MSDRKQNANALQLVPGDHVGAYRIERRLGSGGMAEVFYAIHEELQRPAAIKVLRASLAADDIHLQRFMQEARAAASLVHPNIVQVYDVGRDGEHRYIAQEYIPGSNLRQYLTWGQAQQGTAKDLTDRPDKGDENASTPIAEPAAVSPKAAYQSADRQLPLNEGLSILLQILAALTKSEASGIVHRDIKPENIMLTPEGDVKVADFGLARVLLGDDPQLTRAGTTLGTPMYMSPEQIQEGQVDIRSDLYSLGATTFHMLAGTPPYTGETPLALAMKHVQSEVPDISRFRTDLPASMRQLIARLLAKSPEERFANPKAVLAFLNANRKGDLAEFWPEQAVPLPGATAKDGAGPLRATLILQSKLRKLRKSRRQQILKYTGFAVLVVIAFAIGLGTTMLLNKPFDIDDTSSTNVFKGIEKQPTVQQQYDLALLRKDLHPIYKWEAVGHYFKPDESQAHRVYNAMASLQWAAALQFRGEYAEAKTVLMRTINDPAMADLYKALAYLQLADGASWENLEDNKADIERYVDNAITFTSDRDRDLLDASVQIMHDEVKRQWFPTEQIES